MVAAVLVRQRRFNGGFGLFRQFLRLIDHFSHRIHSGRISSQFFLYIEKKGQSRFIGKEMCIRDRLSGQLHQLGTSLSVLICCLFRSRSRDMLRAVPAPEWIVQVLRQPMEYRSISRWASQGAA